MLKKGLGLRYMKKGLYFLILIFCSIWLIGCSNSEQANIGKVAYIQQGNLWIKSLPDGSAKQFTTDGLASIPRWSVSGKWLLFQKKNQLWVTGSDGRNCRMVADSINAFAWSSTDDVFYYGSEKGGLVSVRPDTMATTMLIKPAPGEIYGRIVNSPDGRYIAFERFYEVFNGTPAPTWIAEGVLKLDIANGKVTSLYKAQPPDQKSIGTVGYVAGWSSDGKIVYIWIGPHSGSLIADAASLTAIDVDTGKNLLADNQKTGSLVHHNWFNTSPVDPNLAALITGGGRETWTNKRLAVINLQTQNVKVVSGPGQAVVSLAFSPSGDSLVYSAGPEEKNMYNGDTTDYAGKSRKVMMQRHLWVVKTDGGPVKQLTGDNSYRDEYPLWSAKGDYILFGRIDNRDKASLWLMGADGSNPVQVVAEISPFDWFGFYGYMEWNQVMDYWRG